jgi:DNA-binding CsgD family transcriptional regulator
VSAPVLVGPSPQGGGPTPSPDWDDILADLGDRVRAERLARHWSLDQLAQQAGISIHTVRRLEDGNIRLRPLLPVCQALGLGVDHLLSDQWQAPALRPRLAPRQVEVLREAVSGDSLEQVGARLGMSSQTVSAMLSRIYVRLGVDGLPRSEKRAAAGRVAVEHDLITPPNRTS